jgi:hypothetical protein
LDREDNKTEVLISANQKYKLRLGWLWDTPERWHWNKTTKSHIKNMIKERRFDLKTLYHLLEVNEDWLEVKEGEKAPVNYSMLHFIYKRYMGVYRKFKPPLLWRLGIKKLLIVFLTAYKEDTAYCERIGGCIQYIIDNKEVWAARDKESRLLAMQDLKLWWSEEDWRIYSHDFIEFMFDTLIEQYESEEFVRKTVDFWIENILINAEKWNRANRYFNPTSWYPRGKGSVNFLVHGKRT